MEVFEKLFKETLGKKINYKSMDLVLMDKIVVINGQKIKVVFEEINSEWRQGIVLKAKNSSFLVNNETIKHSIVLWHDTAPRLVEIEISCTTNNVDLLVHNVWDVGNGVMDYWHNGAAMHVILQNENIVKYICNDGYPDDDLNDLIFTIEKL